MIRKEWFKSRKLWAAVIGVVINGLTTQYPEYKPVILYINGLIGTYILGEAIEGAANAQKPTSINAGVANVSTEPATPEGHMVDMENAG